MAAILTGLTGAIRIVIGCDARQTGTAYRAVTRVRRLPYTARLTLRCKNLLQCN